MIAPFLNRVNSWLLMAVLVFGLWLTATPSVQAGKTPKTLIFDATTSSVEVMNVYETSYAAQKSTIKSLKITAKQMKKAVGFQGGSMLQSQDGKQVIALSQWPDLASYQAYTPSPAMTSGAAPPPKPSGNAHFELVSAQTSIPGAMPALRGKEAVVQLVQFTSKDGEVRSQLLPQVEALLPVLLETQPIPQSVLLLKGMDDDGAIALMVNWNCSAMFEDVGQPGAIAIPPDLMALADSTQQLFNVVTIIPTELPKPEED